MLANEGTAFSHLLFDDSREDRSEMSVTGKDEDEMLRLQQTIGDRLKVELPVEHDALPSKIAELLRLLELKENGRLNGGAR